MKKYFNTDVLDEGNCTMKNIRRGCDNFYTRNQSTKIKFTM